MDVHDDEHDRPAVVINPKLERLGEEVELKRGLSLRCPGWSARFVVAISVAVTGLDRHGRKIRLEGEGLLRSVLQHEIDHLNGILTSTRARISPRVDDEEKEAGRG